jgi:hypothetical protein
VCANLNLRFAISDCGFFRSTIRDPQFNAGRLTAACERKVALEFAKMDEQTERAAV